MIHLTLNTGHTASWSAPENPSELAASASLLPRGGPIPTRPPFRVDITLGPGGGVFTVYRGREPITTTAVCGSGESAAELWESVSGLYLRLSDLHGSAMAARSSPDMPTTPPWAATVLLPHMSLQPPESLLWMGAFNRVLSQAIIQSRPHP